VVILEIGILAIAVLEIGIVTVLEISILYTVDLRGVVRLLARPREGA
jgi:hypothetical protein